MARENDCVTIESVTIIESINSKFHVLLDLFNFETPDTMGLFYFNILFRACYRHFRKRKMKNGGTECVGEEVFILYN